MQFRSMVAAVGAGVLLAIVAAGCGDEEATEGERAEVTEPGPGAEEAHQEAREIYDSRCVPCHGSEGGGDGPAAAGLSPSPRDFGRDDWQQSVDDDHIERIIMFGGAAVGKSPTMPANPDLQSKPEVVAALREHVRSFGQ